MFHSMSVLQTVLISILYKQSLKWWFHCMRLQSCVDSVCVGVTSLMCLGRDVHGWVREIDVSPSTSHWSVEVYVSHGPHQGSTVVFGYIEVSCELYDPNIYRCIRTQVYRTRNCKLVGVGWTSIGSLSEVLVGGRRGFDSDSGWGSISVRQVRDPTLRWI